MILQTVLMYVSSVLLLYLVCRLCGLFPLHVRAAAQIIITLLLFVLLT